MFNYYKIKALEEKKQSENKDLTKDEIANKIGMSSAGYQNIKKGISVPSVEMLEKIANYFEVDMNYFFTEAERKQYPNASIKPSIVTEKKEDYSNPDNCNYSRLMERLLEKQEEITKKQEEITELKVENERLKNVLAQDTSASAG